VNVPNVLSVAGSDPSGGAGIQADLKTFAALGAYGMAALTALTAQNTHGVSGVHLVPPEFVSRQIDAVFDDIRVDAVKLGMLATTEITGAVADSLARRAVRNVVLDPVMVAKGGQTLLEPAAVAALRVWLMPLAFVITPNLPEAGALLDASPPATQLEMGEAVRALHALGPRFVYLKGGHLGGIASPDLLFDGEQMIELTAPRVRTSTPHGTGCTLSSAIAALLPQCEEPVEAMRQAKAYVTEAIATGAALTVGGGHGPVHHFHALWRQPGEPVATMLDSMELT
jgi:hydroxymethylpyrimidine/phosphomethylpyrimidine kinase